MSANEQLAATDQKWKDHLRTEKALPRRYLALVFFTTIAGLSLTFHFRDSELTLGPAHIYRRGAIAFLGTLLLVPIELWLMSLHVGRLWTQRPKLAVEYTNASLQVLAEKMGLSYHLPSQILAYGQVCGTINGINFCYGTADLPPCRDTYWSWSLSFDAKFSDLSLGILKIPFARDPGNPFEHLRKMPHCSSTNPEFESRFSIHSNQQIALPPQVLEGLLTLSNDFLLLEIVSDKCRFIFSKLSPAEDLNVSLKMFEEIRASVNGASKGEASDNPLQ